MEKYFLCQDCLLVIKTEDTEENWKKYHQTMNSCPNCQGDMCGCKFCEEDAKVNYNLQQMKEKMEDLMDTYQREQKRFDEDLEVNENITECSFEKAGDCFNCPLYEEGICVELPY